MKGLRSLLLGGVAAALLGGPALAQENGALAALLQQSRYWQEQNRPDLALRGYERALESQPTNAEALAGAAQAQSMLGNRTAAEALLARLRAAAPGDPRVTRTQETLRVTGVERGTIEEARRLAATGRVPEALARYRDAFDGGSPPDAYAVEYWLTLGGTEGGWEQARQALADFARRRPLDGRAQVAAAQILTWREATRAEGIRRLAALARDPTTGPQAIQAWRQAVLWLGSGRAAVPDLEAFLAVRPNDPQVARRLAEANDPARLAEEAAGAPRREGFDALEANRLRQAASSFETALAARPNDADALGGLGIVRLREGRTAEARDLLERAIAADPATGERWRAALDGATYTLELAQGRAALRRGDLDAAEGMLRRAVARNAADRTDAEALLGDIALRRNDAAAAEARYRTALARRPGFLPAQQGLERALRQQGRIAQADDIARQLRAAAPATGPRDASGGTAARLRAEAARAPDAAAAAALLRAALDAAPNDPWIRLDLARALARQGQAAEARAIVDAPVGAGGGADATFAAAIFAEEQGRAGDAAALIGRIPPRLRSPDMARLAARMRVVAEVEEAAAIGGFEGRQRLLAIAARRDPTGATPAAVVRAFGRMGDARGAEEAARVALAVNRTPSGAARLALAGALLEAGLEQQASAMVNGLEADPAMSAEARRQANALQAGIAVRVSDRDNEAGNQAAGFDRLRPVLARDPQDPAANLALARLYQGARQPAEALRIAETVLARDPRNLAARAGAVDAAVAARDWQRAEALVDEGRALAPNDARVSLMEARIAQARGNNRAALRALERAQEQRRAQVGDVVPLGFAGAPAMPGGGNPFRRDAGGAGQPLPRDPLSAQIARDLEAARDAAATRFVVTPSIRGRSGTAGLDRLEEVALPMEASVSPGAIGGRVAVRAMPVSITSGSLPNSLNALQSFGANPIAFPGGMLPPRDVTASGIALGVSYERESFRADIGSTPLGFRLSGVVGGVEVAPALGGGWRLRLTGERRAVTDSLLSWSGQRDALTGQVWGGVARTGGRAQVEYAQGPFSAYAGAGYAVFDGSGIQDNARIEAGAGVAYAALQRPDERVTVGLDLVYFGYDQNQRFFTLGHGGYFSPQSYTAVNLPVDWRARSGDWNWRLGATLGYAVWSEDSALVFPNDPGLQAQLAGRAASNPLIFTAYPSQTQSGLVGGVRGDIEYAMTRQLAVGASVRYDRAADWNEGRGSLFLRYRLAE